MQSNANSPYQTVILEDATMFGLQQVPKTLKETLSVASYMDNKKDILLRTLNRKRKDIERYIANNQRYFYLFTFTSPEEFRVQVHLLEELVTYPEHFPRQVREDVRFRGYVEQFSMKYTVPFYAYDQGGAGFCASVVNLPWVSTEEFMKFMQQNK